MRSIDSAACQPTRSYNQSVGLLGNTVHTSFIWEFVGKVGAPIFAATLVACLLTDRVELIHIVLMIVGLTMMSLCHWREHHREAR